MRDRGRGGRGESERLREREERRERVGGGVMRGEREIGPKEVKLK